MKRAAIVLVAAAFVLGGGQRASADHASYIAGTNPVGWWGMNETSGSTTADLSGSYGAANNGVGSNITMAYNNPGVTTVMNQAGFPGAGMPAGNKAVRFNGDPNLGNHLAHPGATGNGVEGSFPSGTPAVYNAAAFSAEAWIFVPSFLAGPGDWGTETVMGGRAWRLGFQGPNAGAGDPNHVAGRLHAFVAGGNGAAADFLGDFALTAQTWHQIGMSYDGSTGVVNFFIDGAAAGSQSSGLSGILAPDNTGTNNTFNLGRRRYAVPSAQADEGEQFNGLLDEAVVWNTVRSASEFAASYAAATGPQTNHQAVMKTMIGETAVSGEQTIDMGTVTALNTVGTTTHITLSNDADPVADLLTVSDPGNTNTTNFSVSAKSVSTLAAKASTGFDVQFKGAAANGTYTSDVTISTDKGTLTLHLTGHVNSGAPEWPNYIPGDFNQDGEVGPEDFAILKDHFGVTGLSTANHASWTLGDATADGEVGPEDFAALKDHFGVTGGPKHPVSSVPEPVTLVTLLGLGVSLRRTRRARP